MIGITIICVGKLKDRFCREGAEEYIKRLQRFCSLDIIELKDEPTKEGEKEQQAALKKEGERILSRIPKNSYVISLCVEGRELSSEDLSRKIESLTSAGESRLTFIIGGSAGLWEEVKKISDFKLSFSKMTFPHGLMRVILLEQVYRAFTISSNITYHK